MKKFILFISFLTTLIWSLPASAQFPMPGGRPRPNPVFGGCTYNSTLLTLLNQQSSQIQCDSKNNVRHVIMDGAGNNRSAFVDASGNLQITGSVIQSGTWTVTTTQGTNPWIVAGAGTAGTPGTAVLTVQGIANGTGIPVIQTTASNLNAAVVGTISNSSSAVSSTSTNLGTNSYLFGYNGATWDQLQADAAKNLKVAIVSPTTLTVDNAVNDTPIAAATATATKGLLIGGQYDSTQKTLTNGQQAAYSMSSRGALYVATGADSFAVTGALSNASSGVATTSTNVPTLGYGYAFNGTTWDQLQADASKNLKVSITSPSTLTVTGSGTAGTAASGVVSIQGIASMTAVQVTPNTLGNWALGSTATTVPTAAQYQGVNVGGNLVGLVGDPCQTVAKINLAVNQVTSTTIITGTASKKTYICSFAVVAQAAEIIGVTAGTGTVCATGGSVVMGSATTSQGLSFAANGGMTLGNGQATVMAATSANADNVCLVQNGTNRVSGVLTYVQQ